MNILLEIFNSILFLILFLLIYKYLPSYFQKKAENLATKEDIGEITKIIEGIRAEFIYFHEKAKNLATKEDIGEITKIIEGIRAEFIKDTEKLKANLQLLTQTQYSLINEERQVLLDYHEKYFLWYALCTDGTYGGTDIFSIEKLRDYYKTVNNALYKTLASESIFAIFIDNAELIKLKDDAKKATIDLAQSLLMKTLLELQNLNLEIAKTNISALSVQQKVTSIQSVHVKMQTVNAEFNKGVIKNFETLNPVIKEFQKKSREHLYKIIGDATDKQ